MRFSQWVGPEREPIFVPAHAMEIDPPLQGVFLYGALSPDSADHLVARLATDEANRDFLLAVLSWIGSPEVVPAVAALAEIDGDRETIERIVSVAMHVGGSAGRAAVLALPTASLSPDANAYLDSIRGFVEDERFPSEEQLAEAPRIPADQLRRTLQRMIANDGRDDDLEPTSLLVSDIPTAELIGYLRVIRVAMLRRVSDEALDDVQIANQLLHLLAFRDASSASR